MFVRSALFACAAAFAAFTQTAEAEDASARCEAMTMRVYFSPGSATLDREARDMMATAERNMADCAHAELHVATDGTVLSHARARAVLAQADTRIWDVARVETGAMPVAYSAGPAFVTMTMTPEHSPTLPVVRSRGDAGV